MMFREKSISKLYAFALAAVFAIALAGCGGGGGTTATPEPPPMPDPQMECEDADGEYRDGTCVTAAELLKERMDAQRADIKAKLDAAQTAVGAVDNDSTDAELTDADNAIAAAKAAIAAAEDVPAAEKTANTGTVTALEAQLADAKTARMAAMDDEQMAADAAMMADARKLHKGIGDDPLAAARVGAYGTGTDANKISVTTGATGVTAQLLSEDKDATVAANHGWTGKKYTASGTGVTGTYEAYVYSNVGAAKQGAKFNSGTGDGNVGFALASGALAIDADATNVAKRIVSPSFDHSAGYKTFKLPDPNPSGATMITIPGSYYGVAGRYACTPATAADGCRVNRAADGYTLALTGDGGGTWTFTPTDPNARVTESPDTSYASYGWWLHKSADGKTFTASAFTDNKGTAPDTISGIHATLRGTATYMGGAAGKYALYSSTGGTNDAGHFTARATLEADFNADMITGTIDQFMGADGQSRNWSVELKKSGLSDAGAIGSGTDAAGDSISMAETVWTIGGTAAAADGQWSGQLQESTDGVPQVATGTFHSTYSTSGQMVGAFGATKQ